jgi:uncharacterized protein YbbC (DUF1343 family)
VDWAAGRSLTVATLLAASACGGASVDPRPPDEGARATATPDPVLPPTPPAREEPPPAIEPPVVRIAPEHQDAIDDAVRAAIRARKLPGCVVVIGRRDGVLFRRAYGDRALVPSRERMTLDTIFDLASITKAVVTATLVAELSTSGAIDLDAPAARYLPGFERAGKGAVTVRQLLLHTSGLPSVNPRPDYERGREEALEAIFDLRLESPPGSRYRYSDIGYIVAGEIAERAGGRTLDELARASIFEPLGMSETSFRPAADLLPRIAPTERAPERDGEIIRGAVHDPRAYRLGGVAGNAGLFSTADDLSRFARAVLGAGRIDGERVIDERVIEAVTTPQAVHGSTRTLGWDTASADRRARGFGAGAIAHGGFTGTSLAIDPERDVFVLFLSNRVHPEGRGDVHALIGDIERIALGSLATARPVPAPDAPGVMLGIDILRRDDFRALAGKRVGLLTNASGRARDGRRTSELLAEAEAVTLSVIFTPEHGLDATREGRIRDGRDPRTGVPTRSLFGPSRELDPSALEGLDVIVVDLQDVGARFYTYGATLARVLESAARAEVPVMVLDRPNPSGGEHVSGPVLDPALGSFVNHHALPIRHGLTLGELARLFAEDRSIDVALEVVPVEGWAREMLWPATDLTWTPPSPNLQAAATTLLYPGVALVEGTNVSVGRGTPTPFEVVGAPWIDASDLRVALGAEGLLGVSALEASFIPRAGPHHGVRCRGVRLILTDAAAFDPVRTGLAIARALFALHPREWDATRLPQMIGRTDVVDALRAGATLDEVEALYEPALASFRERRERLLGTSTSPRPAAITSRDPSARPPPAAEHPP